jgi:DNA replication protein DnaC
MAAAWLQQQKESDMGTLSFDERFGMLVDAECVHRDNKRLGRNLKEAKLREPQACIEDIDYPARRNLDRGLVRELATGSWVREHLNVVISGATGTGKTYIACALAQHACRNGHRALYWRAPRLYNELELARADGTYARVLGRIAKVDVLVIDDWGLVPLKATERQDLLELLEDRHGSRSTVLASQLPSEQIHEAIGDPTIADAICDRLLHRAHKIALKGPSRRKHETEA